MSFQVCKLFFVSNIPRSRPAICWKVFSRITVPPSSSNSLEGVGSNRPEKEQEGPRQGWRRLCCLAVSLASVMQCQILRLLLRSVRYFEDAPGEGLGRIYSCLMVPQLLFLGLGSGLVFPI